VELVVVEAMVLATVAPFALGASPASLGASPDSPIASAHAYLP
jgi:benzoyl-CoA reductase/2-hydroxyglutaryl-CoA dehydratase subunit BcrC/BadD/HgdB